MVAHLSFLMSYLTSLYLLEFVAGPNNKVINRLLTHRNPEDFKLTSTPVAQNDYRNNAPQQAEEIKFVFQPVMNILFDFKIFLRVLYPNSELVHK